MDENQQNGVVSEGTETVEPTTDAPALENQTVDVSQDTADFPQDQQKQREAFIQMRQRIKELEGKGTAQVEQQEEDDSLDLLNLSRGVQRGQPQIPQYDQFDTDDPATQQFLSLAQQAQYQARLAEQKAAQAAARMEDYEAWAKYPQLNPKSQNKDKFFIEDVQKEYLAARIKAQSAGKEPPALVEVADRVNSRYEQIMARAREQAAVAERQTLQAKEAAALESRGTSIQQMSRATEDRDALRMRANRGDMDAMAELLKQEDAFLSGWN